MRDFLEQFLNRDDVEVTRPATSGDLESVKQLFGLRAIPEVLLRLWRISDGAELDAINAHILGSSEVIELVEESLPGCVGAGLLPILDDHESNYLALTVIPPLAPRIVHLPHDDGPRILYRDLESGLRNLLEAVDRGDDAAMFLHEAEGDYPPDSPRPGTDQEAARELMKTDGRNHEWNFAAQLLDADNLQEWSRLLETDHFVRREVRARMAKMSSPAILRLLQADQRAFDDFVALASSAAEKAGMKVGRRVRDALQVGESWISLEAFFYRRNIPNAVPRMMDWFQDLLAQRNPNERPGNFMSDR